MLRSDTQPESSADVEPTPPVRAPAIALPERSSFERYEFKYWVPKTVAAGAVRLASAYLQPDAHGPAGTRQRNTSLYLDSPARDFYRAHLEGAPDRLKLRIRTYGELATGPAFFEVKRKVKSVIVKKRAKVPRDCLRDLLEGRIAPPALAREVDRNNLESFLYYQTIHRAEPVILVTCLREAYATTDPNEDVRLTVDGEIAYQPARGADLAGAPRAWIPIDGAREHGEAERRVLIELKFSGAAPGWMQELVERLGMWRGAYSKYVAAVAYETGDRYKAGDFDLAPAAGV